MKCRVYLFARARDLVGTSAVELELPTGATVADVRLRLREQHPQLASLLERSALAVNDEFAEDSLTLPHEAEVALLPPVSGGQNDFPQARAYKPEAPARGFVFLPRWRFGLVWPESCGCSRTRSV